MAHVIRPAAFATEEELDAAQSEAPLSQEDAMMALVNGVQSISQTLYAHRTTFRNVAVIAGGAYLVVKGPPILAQSFAMTMHFLREGWHGRGYEDRWLEAQRNGRSE